MKQRLAGKVIKHAERYPYDMLQRAYEKSVRGLRKLYKRQYKTNKTWMKKWYMHKACEPFFMLCDDVTVDAAIKLLHNIYAEHIDAIAALMSAQDAYLERGDTSEIVDALCGVREFVDDLIKAIKEG